MRKLCILLLLMAIPGSADDQMASHLSSLEKRLPGPEFIYTVQPPFVVVGDLDRAELEDYSRGTVRWAVRLLKAEYFSLDPEHTLDVWLFKDAESYRKNVRKLTGSSPDTPYGFYSREHRGLFMNIHTGGGTLVHELVHPFLEANFPQCPPWFNEGLASLYEQCGEKGGRIWGYTNWRLAGLQTAIRERKLGSIPRLFGLDERDFYRDERANNYAQARYLCLYLQHQGVLREYYRHLRAGRESGPALQALLGFREWAPFQKKWEDWVLGLTYPES